MIYTYKGHLFNYLNPDPKTIVIEDIAHSLSLITRFNGHLEQAYSVAQHSVLCSYFCSSGKWGLLHDAAEGYMGDIPSPLKLYLPDFNKIEEDIMGVVAEVFQLGPQPDDLKEVDFRMLVTEAKSMNHKIDTRGVDPYDFVIEPWPAKKAESMFLARFDELYG